MKPKPILIVMGVLGSIALGYTVLNRKPSTPPAFAKPTQQVVQISLPPLPPPPPPPPPTPPPTKVEEQETKVVETEPEPDKAETPDEPPPEATGLKGPGPGIAGLGTKAGKGNGNSTLGGNRGAGNKYGSYFAKVKSKITEALKTNSKTRKASGTVEFSIWQDSTGRVTKAAVRKSTGDATLDKIIKDEILTGMQFAEPPPSDLKMPVSLRTTFNRPN